MLNIVYTNVASAKAKPLYNLAIENIKAGNRSILIVPEQEAVLAERKIYEMAQDTSLLELEVMNFDRLTEEVFRKCGHLSRTYVNERIKKLLLSKTLSDLAPALKELSDRQDNSDFISILLSQITEFKYAEITPVSLAKASELIAKNDENNNKKLLALLDDLSVVYAAYNSLFGEIGEDACDSLTKCASLIKEHTPYKGAHIYIDSFNGFTAQQFDVIDALLSSPCDITVSLLSGMDEEYNETFEYTNKTSERLASIADKHNIKRIVTKFEDNAEFLSPSIAHIAKYFNVSGRSVKYENESDVTLISTSDVFDECETVASLIAKEIRAGKRYKDILVVMRNADTYKGVLDAALERYGIPSFFSDKTDINEKSLVRYIMSALAICSGKTRYTDIIRYLRCGLTPISEYDTDLLESYASAWRVSGKIWFSDEGFTMNPGGYSPLTAADAEKLEKINNLRRTVMDPVIELDRSVKSAETVKDFAKAIYEFTINTNICEKLSQRIEFFKSEGEDTLALEEKGLWSAFVTCLDELVFALGDEKISLEKFLSLFKMVLADSDIATIPQADDVVTIVDASLLRSGSSKATFMIGCVEGEFPKSTKAGGLLSTEQRKILSENKLEEILFDPASEASKELFYFYIAATSASEKLFLTYPRSTASSDDAFPSSAFTRIRNMFESSHKTSDETDLTQRIINKEALSEHLRYLSSYISPEKLKKEFGNDTVAPDMSLFSKNEKISESVIKKVFPGNLNLSQTSADKYAKCPFLYQCSYALNLKTSDSFEYGKSNLGTFVHSILENILQDNLNEYLSPDGTVDKEKLYGKVKKLTEDNSKLILEYTSEDKRPRLKQMFKRIGDISAMTAFNLASEFAQSGFKPTFFEFNISAKNGGGLMPIKLSLEDGSYVVLNGIADRIDTYVKGDKLYVRVADYKTGTNKFSLESIRMGLNLQLLIYLFSIWENANEAFKQSSGAAPDAKVFPAGAEYVITTPGLTDGTVDENVLERKLEKAFVRSGIYLADPEIIGVMDSGYTKKYVPVNEDMSATNSSVVVTLEEFNDLKDEVSAILTEIGNGIKCGNAETKPISEIPDKSYGSCTYCPMKPVCKNAEHAEDNEFTEN